MFIYTKNLNWQILVKNLVTFKDRMGLKTKNFNNMGVQKSLGIRDSQENNIQGRNCLKSGLGQFLGAWQKRGRRVFYRGESVDTPTHTLTQFWYMPEPEIGLADVSKLNWSRSLLQYNAKIKKKNKKKMQRVLLDLNLNAEYKTVLA